MLAAEVRRDEASSSSFDRKVRSGTTALEALSLGSHEISELDVSCASPTETSLSSATLSPPVEIQQQRRGPRALPSPSAPLDISGTSASSLFRPGSSGRLSFLSCFSSLGGKAFLLYDNKKNYTPSKIQIFSNFFCLYSSTGGPHALDDEQASSSTCECEVGIRPSFYWMDGPASVEQRAEAEESYRFLKADCQDEACVIENFAGLPGLTFAGVFDGHGPHGRAAAKFASEQLPAALAEQSTALHSRSERKKLRAMRDACHAVNSGMQSGRESGFDASLSGTTACFALLVPGARGMRVLLANVGDSRCVLARRRSDGTVEAVPLTVDAKPSLPNEEKRIIACGGVVQQMLDGKGVRRGPQRVFRRGDGVLPGLAMSRALGDSYAQSVGVTWEPMLSAYSLDATKDKDLFLVLGTDGVWDVMPCDDVVDFVERYRCRRDPGMSCAEALTLEAQERWKAAHDEALVDDISVAILHLAPMPPPMAKRNAAAAVGLPRTLSRAASCNDEANALASAWLKEGDANPSHRSPRPLFQYLYRAGEAAGSGDFWDSLPREAPGNPVRIAAADAATAAAAAVAVEREETDEDAEGGTAAAAASSAVTTPSSIPALPTPRHSPSPARAINTPTTTTANTTTANITTKTTITAAGHHHHHQRLPPVSPQKTSSSMTTASEDPHESAVHGGYSLRSPSYAHHHHHHHHHMPSPSSSASSFLPSSSPGILIPPPSAGNSSFSNRHAFPGGGGGGSFGTTSSAPARPGILSASDLRPIRKAYPSAVTLASVHSVPSWDGLYNSSFVSEGSLMMMNGATQGVNASSGLQEVETPRSTESEKSSTPQPRRNEGRHEGKVRRGIPCSYSSVGLASYGAVECGHQRGWLFGGQQQCCDDDVGSGSLSSTR